jgi:hypothetical protein
MELEIVKLAFGFDIARACALLTVMTPLLTIQLAGDLSRVFTHSSRFLPSNRTMASEGGAESTAPGVTTLGTGSQTSVSCGLPLPWARP